MPASMRQYFIIIIFLLPFSLGAQPSAIVKQGRWISAELTSIVFRNDQVLDAIFDGTPEHTNYVFKGDTLVLVKNYYSSVDEFAFERSDSAKFFIKNATARQLVLVPANTNARHLARKPEYRFENLQYMPAEKLRFKSLRLSYTNDSVPGWQMGIDRQGNAVLMGQVDAGSAAGRFTGRLDSRQFNHLQQILQHSLLSRINSWRQNVALTEVNTIRLEVTTTDGNLYRTESQIVPLNLEPLLAHVSGLLKLVSFARQTLN